MLALKNLSKQALDFTKKNYLWIILVVLFLVVVVTLSTKEGFEDFDSWRSLAEYPTVFTEKVATPFLKENTFINYYLPSEKSAAPVSIDSQKLKLGGDVAKVPIDIGNGLAVEAVVKVGPQVVDVKAQKPVKIAKHEVTDIVVDAQTVTIPKQNGVIPGKVSEDGEMIVIPVQIEEQTVEIGQQNAVIPSIEPFRSM